MHRKDIKLPLFPAPLHYRRRAVLFEVFVFDHNERKYFTVLEDTKERSENLLAATRLAIFIDSKLQIFRFQSTYIQLTKLLPPEPTAENCPWSLDS